MERGKGYLILGIGSLVIAMLLLVSLMSGCARDNSQQIAAFRAFNAAVKNCAGEPGCLAATQAAMYGGMLNAPQGDTIGSVLAMALPWGRIFLDGLQIVKGAGSGGASMFVKGDNNQFVGFNELVADRGASIYSPFNATATPSLTQSWSDLYNQDNIRSNNNQ